MQMHIYRETLQLVLENHYAWISITSFLPDDILGGNLRKFALLFTLGIMTAANL
jgi:hypothetical protein